MCYRSAANNAVVRFNDVKIDTGFQHSSIAITAIPGDIRPAIGPECANALSVHIENPDNKIGSCACIGKVKSDKIVAFLAPIRT